MGDGADDALNRALDDEADRIEFLHGRMDILEAYDRGIVDEHGAMESPGYKKAKTCKFCNKGGLQWDKHDGRWVLFEGGEIHNCPVNPLKMKHKP